MKIAILSDIHGNLPALQTVAAHIDQWQPDHVLVNGDIINRGPLPVACWQLVQERAAQGVWQVLRGNHEEYVIQHGRMPQTEANENDLSGPSVWTYEKFYGKVAQFEQLPDGASRMAPDGSELRVRHASMRGNRDGIYPATAGAGVRPQIAPPPAVFVTGHIHHAFQRQVDETLIVNAGSVGQLCFGEKRASYGQVVWQKGGWQAKIIYLPYDRIQTKRDFHDSGFLAEAGPMARLIYEEWRTADPLIYPWLNQYLGRVQSGEIALKTAVSDYLAQVLGKPQNKTRSKC